jgi:hypothetical protein
VEGGDKADLRFRLDGIDPEHADQRKAARLPSARGAGPNRRRARAR